MTARYTFQAPSVVTATVDLGDVLATSSTKTPSLAEDRQHPNPAPSQDLQGRHPIGEGFIMFHPFSTNLEWN